MSDRGPLVAFIDEFNKLDPAKQAETRRRLTILAGASATGRQVDQNLWNEHRLPRAAARDILEALRSAKADAGELKKAYTGACHGHILKGPDIKGARPGLLGRAVTTKRYYAMLVEAKKFSSEASARAAIRRRLGLPASETARRMRRTPLARYVQWATFCPTDRNMNPFDSLPVGADDIRDHLGLDPAEKGQPLLLFVYRLPSAVPILFPTVADAAWHSHFRPAPNDPDIESGLTLPLAESLSPQPEVVHKPVNGDTLRRPIEERRP